MPIVKETYKIDNKDVVILVDLDEAPALHDPYGETREGLVDKLRESKDNFGQGIKLARNCAAVAVKELNDIANDLKPNEFTLELGIKLNGELGATVVKIGSEAHMQVTMMWKLKS
jgi:hypothetical protein